MGEHSDPPLTLRSRLMALVIGTLYLLLVAIFVSAACGLHFSVSVVAVLVGSFVIMACLSVFSVKFVRHEGQRRVRLSTLLLVFVPVAVYLTLFRWLFQNAPPPNGPEWYLISFFLVMFVVVTTAVLLWYAEAIVWFVRFFLRRPTEDVGRSTDNRDPNR